MADTWICMDCATVGANPGNCTACGEGPLLDLRDPQVRVTLRQQDAERSRQRNGRLLVAASAIAAVLGFPLVFVLGTVVGVLAVIGLGAGGYALLRLLLPYRARFGSVT
jgi:hypothetical protein